MVLRGGCWITEVRYARLGNLGKRTPSFRNYSRGFRLVLQDLP